MGYGNGQTFDGMGQIVNKQDNSALYIQRISELESQLQEIEDQHKAVMCEKCTEGERHCTCVPILRDTIARYERQLTICETTSRIRHLEIKRLRSGLRKLEWFKQVLYFGKYHYRYPACDARKQDGHYPSCPIADMLKAS